MGGSAKGFHVIQFACHRRMSDIIARLGDVNLETSDLGHFAFVIIEMFAALNSAFFGVSTNNLLNMRFVFDFCHSDIKGLLVHLLMRLIRFAD